MVTDCCQDVRVLDQRKRRRLAAAVLLDLLGAFCRNPPVGHGRCHDGNVRGKTGFNSLEHFRGRFDMHRRDIGRVGQIDRPGYQGDTRAGVESGARKSVTLFARGAVGDVTHRVDRLVRRTGGDQDMFSGKRKIRVLHVLSAEERLGGGNDLKRFAHPAGAGLASFRHFAAGRSNEADPAFLQFGRVAQGRRVLPHLRIHRRGGQNRLVRGKQHRGGQVIGDAMNHLGHQIGSGGRNQDQVMIAG